jgi:hypothetical protein
VFNPILILILICILFLYTTTVKKKHCTTSEAAYISKQMKAKFTILTHFSQRYPSSHSFTTPATTAGGSEGGEEMDMSSAAAIAMSEEASYNADLSAAAAAAVVADGNGNGKKAKKPNIFASKAAAPSSSSRGQKQNQSDKMTTNASSSNANAAATAALVDSSSFDSFAIRKHLASKVAFASDFLHFSFPSQTRAVTHATKNIVEIMRSLDELCMSDSGSGGGGGGGVSVSDVGDNGSNFTTARSDYDTQSEVNTARSTFSAMS